MALKQVLVDDIDGTEGAETQTFALKGQEYEIDLVAGNLKKLEDALKPFIAAGRKRGQKRKATVTKVTQPSSSADLNAIREWATKKGMTVSDRGRIPRDIVDQFNAEHETKGTPETKSQSLFSAATP